LAIVALSGSFCANWRHHQKPSSQGIELSSVVTTPGRRHLIPVPLSGLLYSLWLVMPRIDAAAGGRQEPTAGKIVVGLGFGIAITAVLRGIGPVRR
jgi:hypothetical protein